MRKKYYIGISLVLLLLILSNVYTCFLYIEAMNIQHSLLVTNKKVDDRIFALELQKENRKNEMILNGIKLNSNTIVTNVKGENKLLSDIIDGNKLILRFSELNCNTCIDIQIANLDKYSDSLGIRNILLFTTYQNHAYMWRFKKVNKIKFEIFNVDSVLDSVLTDIGIPYLFVLTPYESRIQNMYIPPKESFSSVNAYLHSVKHKYFQ